MDPVFYPLLLIVGIVLQVSVYSVMRTRFCRVHASSDADIHLLNSLSFAVSGLLGLLFWVMTSEVSMPSLYTLLIGVGYGITSAIANVSMMKAVETGPMSYSTVISTCSMIIPALSGLIIYGEPVALSQWIGVFFMLISFVCSVDGKDGQKNSASVKWLLYCLLSFVFSGLLGVLQKVHQTSPDKEELSPFLIISFLVTAVYSFAYMLWLSKKKGQPVTVLTPQKRKSFAGYTLVLGLATAYLNIANTFLAGVLPSVLFFPIFNGSVMIFSALSGILLFKERLSKKQWIGISVGGVAILLLCGLF